MPPGSGADDRRRAHVERMLARARKRSRQAQKIVAKWEAKLTELDREDVATKQPRLWQEEHLHISDRSVPVARILPFRQEVGWEREAQLVASGALKMPEEALDWDGFFLAPAGNVFQEIAVEAALESRGDR